MIRDTVFLETPDSRAMSLIVAGLPSDCSEAMESAFLRKGISLKPFNTFILSGRTQSSAR
ncbi:hypothetical protein D3C71_1335760 [compost metagenome]